MIDAAQHPSISRLKGLDMQYVNQLIYAILFAFSLKLSFGSFLDFKRKEAYLNSHIYWTLAAGFLAISCLGWAMAASLGLGLLTLAAGGLIASMACMALLFRSFNQPVSKHILILMILIVLAFTIQFEIFRIANDYQTRSKMTTVVATLLATWQFIELRRFVKKDSSYHLKVILFMIVVTTSLTFLRLYEVTYNNVQLVHNIYTEEFLMFAIRACFTAGHVVILISLNNYFYERLWLKANENLSKKENQMLSSLKLLSLARDNETGNHIVRTQHYVKIIATRLKNLGYYTDQLSDDAIEQLFKAAPLHDIGKVGIPDEILLKPGKLTPSEWDIMKTHTTIGESVLGAAETALSNHVSEDVITKAIKIAGGHHEKWDGSGYPRGLKGQEIPLEARIMSLADMYDALVSERVYKKAWSHDRAVKEIMSKKNTQFDPLVVDAFFIEASHFDEISKKLKD